MNKKLSAIVIATLLPVVLFTACKQNNIPDSPSETVNNIITEKVTVADTTAQESTEQTTVTTTTPPTDPVSDPTRASTTSVPDVFINFLYKPEKIIFYHNAKPQTLTEEMADDVIKRINKATKENHWSMYKLYVTEEYVSKIIEENLCIEIYYDGVHILNNLNNKYSSDYNFQFEKILIPLEGEMKNTMFFFKDGEYQSGPIGSYDSDFSEGILRDIFDEWVTRP